MTQLYTIMSDKFGKIDTSDVKSAGSGKKRTNPFVKFREDAICDSSDVDDDDVEGDGEQEDELGAEEEEKLEIAKSKRGLVTLVQIYRILSYSLLA